MSTEVSWQVELEIQPGAYAAFRELTQEMVEAAASESGAFVYERYASEDELSVWVYERYADSEAAVAHLKAFSEVFGARYAELVTRKSFRVFGPTTSELRNLLNPMNATYCPRLAGFSRFSRA